MTLSAWSAEVIGAAGLVKALDIVAGPSAPADVRNAGSEIKPPIALRRDSDGGRILFIFLSPALSGASSVLPPGRADGKPRKW
jgi:hypothetical protein